MPSKWRCHRVLGRRFAYHERLTSALALCIRLARDSIGPVRTVESFEDGHEFF